MRIFSLVFQIMECVVVNLTIVYALLAYSSIKQKDFNNVYVSVCVCVCVCVCEGVIMEVGGRLRE